jgi:hypothetical protein
MGRQCSYPLLRIVSGGQTGADRAALDFALGHGIPHGGWCPQGRLAEDGAIARDYALQETPTPYYAERTEWNVRDSDATVIFSIAPDLTGGSRTTAAFAGRLGKPWLHLSLIRDGTASVSRLREFLWRHQVKILNVAGPRASGEPEIGAYVTRVLTDALSSVVTERKPGR